MTQSESTLVAENLSRAYGSRIAVNNLSLQVQRGEVVGLLGVNGTGKSTTMNMLAGILTPDQGQINIATFDLKKNPMQARAELGYLPEKPPLYVEMTVDQYLRYAAQLRRVEKKHLPKALANAKQRCGLSDQGNRLIRNLSKGYQQRVGIAQAIIHSPSIVILDEPTVGLDPVQIRDIRQLIRELGEQHSVLLSTHILPEVQSVCDRALIMREGQILRNAKICEFDKENSLEKTFIELTCGEAEIAA